MAYRIVLLTEQEVLPEEADTLTSLHDDQEQAFYVVMPASPTHHGIVAALDDLLLGRVTAAWRDVEEPAEDAPMAASLRRSIELLSAAGVEADGRLVAGDPVRALRQAVSDHRAEEVIVLNPPHIVEESLHRDWASRARHAVGVPVLRIVAHAN